LNHNVFRCPEMESAIALNRNRIHWIIKYQVSARLVSISPSSFAYTGSQVDKRHPDNMDTELPTDQNTIPSTTNLKESFRALAHITAEQTGSASAFLVALLVVIGWLISGPYFRYSDSWQLVINTGTTIVTFLMVFLIQNTQNRDTREIHLKLDELIRSHEPARNLFMNLERLSDEELDELAKRLAIRAKSGFSSTTH
jgi:low affinity Fe/Cu permease